METLLSWPANERVRSALLGLTALVLLILFASTAWVSEDAHITIRTIDNFVNGHGLRWNVDERVQTYTHPLWMLLITPVYFVTREIYFTLTTIGLACSLGAYLLIAKRFRETPLVLLAAVFAPWALSRSLVRYATSGFENPLTLLLLAAFAVMLLAPRDDDEVPWGRLALLAGLAAVNRLDTVLLYGPPFALLLFAHRQKIAWGRIVLGLSPLAAWLLFSVVYYGFAYPNTAYAKLSSEFPRTAYLTKGGQYLADLFVADPVSAALLSLGVVATVVHLRRFFGMPGEPGPGRIGGLGAGAILYGFYIVWIGGDFLSGRFWTAPVLVSIVVCATSVRPFVSWLGQRPTPVRVAWMAAAVLFMVTAMAVSAQITETNRALIRTFPAGHLRLTARLDWEITPEGAYLRKLGRDARLRAERTQQSAQVLSVIGLGGVEAGPDVKIIDRYALGDPLLARLPPAHVDQLKVGHLARKLPQGYRHARETGSLVRMDPALAEYYGKLRLIIAGPIWSRERLVTIVRFNLGWFDDLLLEYEQRNRNGV